MEVFGGRGLLYAGVSQGIKGTRWRSRQQCQDGIKGDSASYLSGPAPSTAAYSRAVPSCPSSLPSSHTWVTFPSSLTLQVWVGHWARIHEVLKVSRKDNSSSSSSSSSPSSSSGRKRCNQVWNMFAFILK